MKILSAIATCLAFFVQPLMAQAQENSRQIAGAVIVDMTCSIEGEPGEILIAAKPAGSNELESLAVQDSLCQEMIRSVQMTIHCRGYYMTDLFSRKNPNGWTVWKFGPFLGPRGRCP